MCLTSYMGMVSHTHPTASIALGHSYHTSTLGAMGVRVIAIILVRGGVTIIMDEVMTCK